MERILRLLAVWLLSIASPLATSKMATGQSWEVDKSWDELLSKTISVHYERASLAEIAADLRNQLRVNIHLDPIALTDLGLEPSSPAIDLHLTNVSVETLLDLFTEPASLEWCVKENVLVITSGERSLELVETRVYKVEDLIADESTGFFPDADSLTDIIVVTVSPDFWDEVGGGGTMIFHEMTRTLVISQPWRIHRDIRRLLRDLRTARGIDLQQPTIADSVSLATTVVEAPKGKMRKPARRYAQTPNHPQSRSQNGATTGGMF